MIDNLETNMTFQEAKREAKQYEVPPSFYNCGGYALGCYTWVLPIKDWDLDPFGELDEEYNFDEMEEITAFCVDVLLNEIEELRPLEDIDSPLEEEEVLIAFRISSDGDFHFLRSENKGKDWTHKRGSSPRIESFEKDLIFTNWFGRYNGPIRFFALKEEKQ